MRWLWCGLVCFLLSIPRFVLDADGQTWLLPKEARFRPDGKIEIDGKLDQYETGIYNGVKYRFRFKDGRGLFAAVADNSYQPDDFKTNWIVSCTNNRIDDVKSCSMFFKGLFLLVTDRNEVRIDIHNTRAKLYPGSEKAIRINNEPPFRADKGNAFDFKTSVMIVERLKTNPTVIVRHHTWPGNDRIDETFQVFGFPETYTYLQWAARQIQ
jgi:hypothetical protein